MRKEVENKPESFEALRDLGHFLRGMKRLKEAEKAMKKALKLSPHTKAGAHTWIAMGLILFDKGDFRGAECHLLEGLNH